MERLIKLVKENPSLYDCSHVDYVKPKLKDEIWNKIALKLDYPSGEAVKDQWRKLRDCHRDALRRQNWKEKNGEPNPKRWLYQKQMEFLLPYRRKKDMRIPEIQIKSDVMELGENCTEEGENSTEVEEHSPEFENSVDTEQLRANENPMYMEMQKEHSYSNTMKETVDHLSLDRDFFRERHLQNDDPLLQFFMSMYNTTKTLPHASQLKIKRSIFHAVSEEEEKLINSDEQAIASGTSASDKRASSGHHEPNYIIP